MKNHFSYLFQTLSEKRWDVGQENFWLRSQNWKLQIQRTNFYLIPWYSMTHFVRFRILAEIFWRVYWNCFLRALRIVLTEEKFSRIKKCFFMIFGVRAEEFQILGGKMARMPNLCSISPEEQFEETNVEKKKHLLAPFQTLTEIRWDVGQKTFGCVL